MQYALPTPWHTVAKESNLQHVNVFIAVLVINITCN